MCVHKLLVGPKSGHNLPKSVEPSLCVWICVCAYAVNIIGGKLKILLTQRNWRISNSLLIDNKKRNKYISGTTPPQPQPCGRVNSRTADKDAWMTECEWCGGENVLLTVHICSVTLILKESGRNLFLVSTEDKISKDWLHRELMMVGGAVGGWLLIAMLWPIEPTTSSGYIKQSL